MSDDGISERSASNDGAARYGDHPLVRGGLLIAGVGVLPLLLTILAAELGLTGDPEPNPVFFGILAYLTFWPGLGLAAIGAVKVWLSRRG